MPISSTIGVVPATVVTLAELERAQKRKEKKERKKEAMAQLKAAAVPVAAPVTPQPPPASVTNAKSKLGLICIAQQTGAAAYNTECLGPDLYQCTVVVGGKAFTGDVAITESKAEDMAAKAALAELAAQAAPST